MTGGPEGSRSPTCPTPPNSSTSRPFAPGCPTPWSVSTPASTAAASCPRWWGSRSWSARSAAVSPSASVAHEPRASCWASSGAWPASSCSSVSPWWLPARRRVLQLLGRYTGTVRTDGTALGQPAHRPARGSPPGSATTRPTCSRSTTPTATRSRSPPWSSGRSRTPRRRRVRGRRLHRVRRHPDRDRGPAHRQQLPVRLPRRPARCPCATTPTRSPSGCRTRSACGSRPPEYRSSNPG